MRTIHGSILPSEFPRTFPTNVLRTTVQVDGVCEGHRLIRFRHRNIQHTVMQPTNRTHSSVQRGYAQSSCHVTRRDQRQCKSNETPEHFPRFLQRYQPGFHHGNKNKIPRLRKCDNESTLGYRLSPNMTMQPHHVQSIVQVDSRI